MNIFKNIFKKKSMPEKRNNEGDDYKVKTGKHTDIVIRILSLVAAIVIWAAVVNINTAEYKFTNISVLPANYSITDYTGYTQNWSVDYINVKVKGKKSIIDTLTSTSASASVDFSKVNSDEIKPGYTVTIPIKLVLPDGVTLVTSSDDKVTIVFEKKAQ